MLILGIPYSPLKEDHCDFAMALVFLLLSGAHDFMLAVCRLHFVTVLCLLYLCIPQIEPRRFLIQHRLCHILASQRLTQGSWVKILKFSCWISGSIKHSVLFTPLWEAKATDSRPAQHAEHTHEIALNRNARTCPVTTGYPPFHPSNT